MMAEVGLYIPFIWACPGIHLERGLLSPLIRSRTEFHEDSRSPGGGWTLFSSSGTTIPPSPGHLLSSICEEISHWIGSLAGISHRSCEPGLGSRYEVCGGCSASELSIEGLS